MIEKTTKTCPICGKEFEIVGNARNRKYCSTQCLRRAGLTTDKRKSIIKRAGNYNNRVNLARYYGLKCRVCGWSLPSGVSDENGKINKMGGCEMHHITPVSEGGTDGRENLILLCPNHHQEAHYGILSRDMLKGLVITKDEIDKREIEQLKLVADVLDRMF